MCGDNILNIKVYVAFLSAPLKWQREFPRKNMTLEKNGPRNEKYIIISDVRLSTVADTPLQVWHLHTEMFAKLCSPSVEIRGDLLHLENYWYFNNVEIAYSSEFVFFFSRWVKIGFFLFSPFFWNLDYYLFESHEQISPRSFMCGIKRHCQHSEWLKQWNY